MDNYIRDEKRYHIYSKPSKWMENGDFLLENEVTGNKTIHKVKLETDDLIIINDKIIMPMYCLTCKYDSGSPGHSIVCQACCHAIDYTRKERFEGDFNV